MTHRVAICTHFAIEHFRGGEKWAVHLANRLAAEPGIDVSVHSLPYVPGNERRVDAREVLDPGLRYETAWRHDLSHVDTAYLFYHPGARWSFPGADTYIAGIHSWIYVSPDLFESHYGPVPTAAKLLYRALGRHDLRHYDGVHSVTPAFDSPHPNTAVIPNFVDRELFRPDRAALDPVFTVLVTAAHIEEKGWDIATRVAGNLPDHVRVLTTGTADSPHVEGLGHLSEERLADRYARAHVVLHPARVDTDSMVINEALASGTPVVTSPLVTHVRENDAVLHGGTVFEMVSLIEGLAEEYRTRPDAYEDRCRLARESSVDRGIPQVFPRLEAMLTRGVGAPGKISAEDDARMDPAANAPINGD